MRLQYSLLISLFTLLMACNSNTSNRVPVMESTVTIDGTLEVNEWNKALEVDLESEVVLLLGQNEKNLFLGIKRDSVARYVDLYIKTGDSLKNIHASMQLGERSLYGEWNDTIPGWNWGNNKLWTANKVSLLTNNDSLPFSKQVNPYDGFEFTIDKSMLGSNTFRLFVEIKDFMGEAKDIKFPKDATRKEYEKWYKVRL
jgi:hypothetical protein